MEIQQQQGQQLRRRRRKKTKQEPKTGIQRLYDACKFAFIRDASPSAKALQLVGSLVEEMTCTDIGLDQASLDELAGDVGQPSVFRGRRLVRRLPSISYIHIFQSRHFSIGVFCLPPSAVIPLHDHPGMTVFSKLLYGSMHIKSYDWINKTTSTSNNGIVDGSSSGPAKLAKLVVNRIFTAPCKASVLHPEGGGNIHALTAITQCAVLDVLAPPYSPQEGRHCAYYREVPRAEACLKEDEENHAWLEEWPIDCEMRLARYRGPALSDL